VPPVLALLRSTGFDPPYGRPAGAHPGVRLESHFWRFVDEERRRVVLAFVTLCRDDRGRPWASAAVACRHPDGRTTLAERRLAAVQAAPGRLALRAGDALAADATAVRIAAGDGDHVDVRVAAPRPWSRAALGGLGLGHVAPGLTQYWHPHLLGGRVHGTARVGGEDVDLDGALAYGEKNWGRGGIPPAWWWGQGFLAGGDASVAFAGGVLAFRAFTWKATALAVRVGDELHAWAPPQLLRTRVDTRRWRIDASSARGVRVAVEAVAPGAPLDLPVPVPAERRTEPLSHQHQDGRLRLTVWRGGRRVVRETTTLAGLERGGPLLPEARVVRGRAPRGR